METFLYGATVTLREDEVPSVSVGGAMVDGAWKTGLAELVVSATDNTGVRKRRVLVDGAQVAAQDAPAASDGGCRTPGSGSAYTYALPCDGSRGANGTITRAYDPSGWPQGVRTLTVEATDTAGNTATTAGRTVRIDTVAPAVPQVRQTSTWTPTPSLAVDVPSQPQGSPIAKARLLLCPPATQCRTTDQSVTAGTARPLDLGEMGDGTATAYVRFVDEAGNVGDETQTLTLTKDATPPSVTDLMPSGGTVPAGTTLRPAATVQDPLSGVASTEYEVSIDGEAFAPATTVTAEPGRRFVFRARARDRAGNQGTWTTGAAVVTDPLAPATPGSSPDPAADAAPAPEQPAAPAPAAPRPGCRLAITGTRIVTRRRVFVEGRAPAGVRLTASAPSAPARRVTVRATGRFAVTLAPARRTWRRLTVRATAPGCVAATRSVRRG